MFVPQPGPLAPGPPGLLAEDRPRLAQLRPWALLERLRPVTLTSLAGQVANYQRTVTGLRLVQKYFPAALADYGDLAGTGWYEVLAHLNNLVEEAGWWQVDWAALNEAWAWWMEEPEENGERLAGYLTCIPARHYGLSPETLLSFPPLELLYVLLDGSAGAVSSDLLIALELYDNLDDWSESDRTAAWDRLHRIEADPGRYPGPVRWLPELARWVCRRTGNHLLDRELDPYQDGAWLSWEAEAEVEQTRSAWRRAGPVIEQFRRLMHWYEADPSRLTILANFIMEGINNDQLDW